MIEIRWQRAIEAAEEINSWEMNMRCGEGKTQEASVASRSVVLGEIQAQASKHTESDVQLSCPQPPAVLAHLQISRVLT